MREVMLSYFAGEKHAALVLLAAGTIAVVASGLMLVPRFGLRPMGFTTGVFALVLLAIGVGLYARTGPQVEALLAQLASDAPAFHAGEAARMTRVQRSFVLIEYVELAVILAGAISAVAFKSRPVLAGVALGFVINAAFLLAFDIVAERRGAIYLSELSRQR
jgi:hypothetical protein